MDALTPDRRVIRRFVLVGCGIPAVAGVIALALQLAWLPQLPDPVAIHWGTSGEPNGFGSPWTYPALTVLLCFVLPALMAGSSLHGLRRGQQGSSFRFMGALAAAFAAGFALMMTLSVHLQRGLADATAAPGVGGTFLAGLGLAGAVGVAAWFAQPHQEGRRLTSPAATVPVAPGERTVWARYVTTPLWVTGLLALAAALVTAVGFTAMRADPNAWIMVAIGLLLALLTLSFSRFHVRADATGLSVRSALGWPHLRVRLADITAVEVRDINAMGDFGGWGWRLGPGSQGLITRSGPALWVERRAGRAVVVTVDDAATGAGVLQAYRSAQAPAPGAAGTDA